jgi:ATP-dependent RNA helicase DeaD
MNGFKDLGLSEPFLKVIDEKGFSEPTKIQEEAIPAVISGKDVIAGSKTGSGKTLAFGAGIIEHFKPDRKIKALIMTPTRELAEQVCEFLGEFSSHKNLEVTSVYGGVGINPQIKALKTADVVVGTPGRLLDHIGRKTIDLSNVKLVVLDEADRMLDMGFIDDVEKIIKHCPKKRQTLLFSATISPDVVYLSKKHLDEPKQILVESTVDASKLKQVYYDVKDNIKFSLLVHLLSNDNSKLTMVFCNSRNNVDFVSQNLKLNDIPARAIHGGFSQDKRTKTIEDFSMDGTRVLVCTDVAARGLDIDGVTHVYNYDVPREAKQYIHRIGRTARAGKEGLAINILSERHHDEFRKVLSLIREKGLDIERIETPFVKRVKIKRVAPQRGFGRRGGRPRRNGSRGRPRGRKHKGYRQHKR